MKTQILFTFLTTECIELAQRKRAHFGIDRMNPKCIMIYIKFQLEGRLSLHRES